MWPYLCTTKTYEKVAIKALVATLHHLFDLIPRLRVIISGVVRNADTFESFNNECRTLEEDPFIVACV